MHVGPFCLNVVPMKLYLHLRLLTNFLCFSDRLMCLSRIDQAGKGRLICLSRIDQAEKAAWFAWAGFLVLLRKSGNQANYLISLKVLGMRMIVYTAWNSLNFLWDSFYLEEPPYFLDYYKSENQKIWKSGGCLIGQTVAWLIRLLPDQSGRHHG